jgi:hypothetical protein
MKTVDSSHQNNSTRWLVDHSLVWSAIHTLPFLLYCAYIESLALFCLGSVLLPISSFSSSFLVCAAFQSGSKMKTPVCCLALILCVSYVSAAAHLWNAGVHSHCKAQAELAGTLSEGPFCFVLCSPACGIIPYLSMFFC